MRGRIRRKGKSLIPTGHTRSHIFQGMSFTDMRPLGRFAFPPMIG
jgi:hypothetical protein